MPLILLTGFERWGDIQENPTGRIVRNLEGGDIIGEVLPVSFSKAGLIMEELIREIEPTAILNLGLAPERPVIKVERIAINIIDAAIPDNDGMKPVDEPIDEDGPLAYVATIPTRKIVEAMRSTGIPAFLSYSAGTYLCNYVMYKSLRIVDKLGLKAVSGFIHVPYSSEMASRIKRPVPSLPMFTLKRAIEIALDVIREATSSYLS